MNSNFGTKIKSNARDAQRFSALLSPTRSFVATDKRGVYFMPADDEVTALRDADFLAANGATVIEIVEG